MLMRKLIENSKVFSLNIYHEVHDIEQNDYCHPIKQEMYQKRGCTMRGSIRIQGIEHATGYLAVYENWYK